MSYSKSQWVTVSHSELQWVTMSHSESQWVTVSYSEVQWITASYSELQWVTASYNESQWVTLISHNKHTEISNHTHPSNIKEPASAATQTYRIVQWFIHCMIPWVVEVNFGALHSYWTLTCNDLGQLQSCWLSFFLIFIDITVIQRQKSKLNLDL